MWWVGESFSGGTGAGKEAVQLLLGGRVPGDGEVPPGRVLTPLGGELTPEGPDVPGEVVHAAAEPRRGLDGGAGRAAVHGGQARPEAPRGAEELDERGLRGGAPTAGVDGDGVPGRLVRGPQPGELVPQRGHLRLGRVRLGQERAELRVVAAGG